MRKEHHLMSVVVPLKNDAANIVPVLLALKEEKNKKIIKDIIVVDNNSTDNSFDIAMKLVGNVLGSNGFVSEVRNYGAARVNTPFIAFIDSDVVISRGWSEVTADRIMHATSTEWENFILGSTYYTPENAGWVESTWFESLTARKNQHYINGGNLIVSKRLFDKLNGFDTRLSAAEDVDFCERAVAVGGKLLFVPDLHTVHLGYPKSIGAFFRREKWHGQMMKNQLPRFWRNKALTFALLHWLFCLLVLVSLAAKNIEFTAGLFIYYSLALLIIAVVRTKKRSIVDVLRLIVLLSVYGFARAISLAESVLLSKHG